MKFSLQSLMLAMVVLAIVFGRVAHLKRWADYHDREATRLVEKKLANGWEREYLDKIIEERKDSRQRTDYWDIDNHRRLAKKYQAAIYRPWRIVKEREFPYDPWIIEWKKRHHIKP